MFLFFFKYLPSSLAIKISKLIAQRKLRGNKLFYHVDLVILWCYQCCFCLASCVTKSPLDGITRPLNTGFFSCMNSGEATICECRVDIQYVEYFGKN